MGGDACHRSSQGEVFCMPATLIQSAFPLSLVGYLMTAVGIFHGGFNGSEVWARIYIGLACGWYLGVGAASLWALCRLSVDWRVRPAPAAAGGRAPAADWVAARERAQWRLAVWVVAGRSEVEAFAANVYAMAALFGLLFLGWYALAALHVGTGVLRFILRHCAEIRLASADARPGFDLRGAGRA
jgi:hypothetical protein